MNENNIKMAVKYSKITLYLIVLLFVSSYFDLGISTEILLQKLLSKLPLALLFSLLIVWFEDWAMKKGGFFEEEGDG